MNTLEWMPIFLPSLWLFAIYNSDAIAALVGLVWIVGRVLYMTGYSQAAEKRGPGFFIQSLACGVLVARRAGRDRLADSFTPPDQCPVYPRSGKPSVMAVRRRRCGNHAQSAPDLRSCI